MAKTTQDLLIKLGIKGIEGVERLKGSLRALSTSLGPTDKNLEKIARQVKNFNRVGGDSRQVIAGQIDALKGLRAQATLGGEAFKRLSKDVAAYEAKLKSVDAQIDSTGAKIKSLRQVETQFTKRSIEGLESQIDKRTKLLEKERPLTAAYAQQLGGILAIEEAILQAKQRQAVIAGAQRQAEITFGGFKPGMPSSVTGTGADLRSAITSDLPELPNTLNAINLELGEQRSKLQDLDVTSEEYAKTQKIILDLEQRLKAAAETRTQAVIDQERRLKQLDEQEQRRARRAAKVAGIQAALSGGRGDTLQIGSRDPRTGAIIAEGTAPLKPQVPVQVREISSLYKNISDIGMAEISADIDRMGKSVNDVTADIKAATAASNGSIKSLQNQRTAFASLRAGLDPTSKDFRQLSREIERVDRKLAKLSNRKGLSLKGVAQTAGGVAAGGIFGGPEGALGALAGAPFGPGGVAAGAALGAQVGIARKGIEGFADYAASIDKALIALEGIAGSQENYNLLLSQAKKVTAELNVPQEVAIRGITRLAAAVLGAQGNVNDAALAFTNVIIAIKGTAGGAEDVNSAITALVQIFSKGKVSAEELSGQLGERFPAAVTEFAKANDMTTMELQSALKQGTVGLGELMNFLVSIGVKYDDIALAIAASNEEAGARSQVAFNEMRIAIGRAIKPIGAELQTAITDFVMNNIDAIKALAQGFADFARKTLDGLALLIKHGDKIKDLIAIIVGGALGGKLLGLIIGVGARLIPLAKRVGIVRTAVLLLNKTLMLNPFILMATGITAAGVAINNYVNRHDRFIAKINTGAATLDEAKEGITAMKNELAGLERQQDINTGFTGQVKPLRPGGLEIDKEQLRPSSQQPQILENQINQLKAKITAAEVALANRTAADNPLSGLLEGLGELTEFGKLTPTGGDGDKDITDAQLKTRIAGLKEAVTFKELEAKFFNDIKTIQADQIEGNKKILAFHEAGVDYARARTQLEEELLDLEQELGVLAKQAELDLGLITEEQFKQFELEQEMVALKEKFNALLINEKLTQEEIDAILEKIRKGLKAAGEDPSFKEGFLKGLEEMMDVTPKLVDVAISAVQGLGDAIHQMVTTGKADFKELAASVLSDISRIMIQAALAGALKKMLGSANGNVIQGGRIKPYAQGGVVSGPTVFPMADGNIGLMGEAGAEAIMPLKRGPSGRLGVEVTNQGSARDAMNRYSRRSAGAAGGGVASEDEAIAAVQGSSAAIDVRYSVERINNVDYVTATEFQQGLQQAAAQGAQRGEQQTLRRLQMSSSTRRRIGV